MSKKYETGHFALLEMNRNYGELLQNTNGEWIKFPKGSDHKPLVDSLAGKATGWCTATDETAKKQLDAGDFYVYYSEDEEGKFTIPRVAIRMEGNSISEVRGIEKDQNLDPYIGDIAEEKLKDFGEEGEKYKKRVDDMKKFNNLYRMLKINPESEVSKEDLTFLYEIDNKIEGFGYSKDPRIKELRKSRNSKKDLSIIFDCKEDEISTNSMDCLNGKKIVCHYGNFSLDKLEDIPDGTVFPEIIYGDFLLKSVKKLGNNVVLPKKIYGEEFNGYSDLRSLEYIGDNVIFSEFMDLRLTRSFTNIKIIGDNVIFPKLLRGDMRFGNLESIGNGVIFPEEIIVGSIEFNNLKEIGIGIKYPKKVSWWLKVPLSIILSGKFDLPDYIGKDLTIKDDLTKFGRLFQRLRTHTFKTPKYIGEEIKAPEYIRKIIESGLAISST